MMGLPPFRRSRGFTLIELLVVIVIIAILMAIAIPAYLAQQTKAQDTKTKQYLNYAYRDIRSSLPEANNVFQKSTSLVSVVSASEPQLTIASGNCAGGLLGSAADSLIVDSATTPNSLSLCAKSKSGNLWRLISTPSGQHQVIDGSAIPLSVNGTEITDATRSLSVQGDGLTNDSSTGLWESRSNLSKNGGAETGTGNWASLQATLSSDSTYAKFGTKAFKCTLLGNQANEGCYEFDSGGLNSHIPVTAGQTYAASAWIYTPTTVSIYAGRIEWFDNTGTQLSVSVAAPTTVPSNTWTRITYSATAPASAVGATITWYTNVMQGGTSFWIDGVQFEQGPMATPYIQTTNAVVTRNPSRVQAPSSVLNATQGWFASRIRIGYSSSQTPGTYSGLAAWGDGNLGNNALMLFRYNSQWRMERSVGGVTSSALTASQTWNSGDYITVVGYWNATQVAVSVGGGAFVVAANSNIPTLAATTFDIGVGQYVNNALQWCNCDVLWFAAGTGTLTNSDAGTINGFGNSDPKRSSFPSASQATFTWDGSGTNGSIK
jgi:type IV pilus assembly protein PilA